MSIPFLHFPYVVQEAIFKSMEYSEVFVMSLCSKRMKYCVIRAKRKVPKIWYVVFPHDIRIAVEEEGGQVETVFGFVEKPELNEMKSTMELKIGEDFKGYGT
ncbi:hypothetical protein CRE_06146 [Caenorhabditis remanei]|uniref:F-box domain-containing protein n=1 Tax=Caenorhabditis remanei TaxID=31234 RepID=E3NGU8_CAERE|nr:hypothetical protein CRE_06146 [Caenorhabditis remanei]